MRSVWAAETNPLVFHTENKGGVFVFLPLFPPHSSIRLFFLFMSPPFPESLPEFRSLCVRLRYIYRENTDSSGVEASYKLNGLFCVVSNASNTTIETTMLFYREKQDSSSVDYSSYIRNGNILCRFGLDE